MNGYGVLLFHTTSSAFRAEKILMQAGLAIRLFPTPRELSSDCGVACRFPWEQVELVRSLLESEQVEIASIHHL